MVNLGMYQYQISPKAFGFWGFEFRVLDSFGFGCLGFWVSFGFGCVGLWVSILPVNYDNDYYEKH